MLIRSRPESHSPKPTSLDIKVGDTVTPISPLDKHKVRDIYLVTGEKEDKVSAQRLLHPLSDMPLKFMSREYTIHPKHLQRLHRLQFPSQDYDESDITDSNGSTTDNSGSIASKEIASRYLDTDHR